MTNKEKYKLLCSTEKSIPVFSRDWWLDTVCGSKNWDVLLIETKGIVEASMPLYFRYPGVVSMPIYAQTMGIWFNPKSTESNYTKELIRKQNLCEEIIRKMPCNKSFLQNFHYTFTDWLPFYYAGYKQTTRYTYIIPDIGDENRVWNNFSKDIKNNIKKAQAKYKITVKRGVSTKDFLRLNELIFKRQGKTAINLNVLEKLVEYSRINGYGDIWGAFDEQNQLHAAHFIVWQENSVNCIAGGSVPDFRKSGAHSLVMLELIRFASTVSRSFDFTGSMLKGVEYFNRGFGAVQTPYFTIIKGNLNFMRKAFYYSLKKINRLFK